jgi:hypothetical protein
LTNGSEGLPSGDYDQLSRMRLRLVRVRGLHFENGEFGQPACLPEEIYGQFTVKPLLRLVILSLATAAGCASINTSHSVAPALIAPPLPKSLASSTGFIEYYPDASRRAKEVGRVVVSLKIGSSGTLDGPIAIDEKQTSAAPRLVDAATKILSGVHFDVDNTYKRSVVVSLVFEIEPCGTVTHAEGADYRLNLCLDPNPYAYYVGADKIPPSDLETKLHQILMHNDLADIDFLEKTLGISFRVTKAVDMSAYSTNDSGPHVKVTPQSVPASIAVEGLRYSSRTDQSINQTTFEFRFTPHDPIDVALWSAHWKARMTQVEWTHGAGRSEETDWGGEHGIHMSVNFATGGGRDITLSQRKTTSEPFASHTDMDLISAKPLVREIIALISEGDLRDVKRTAGTLHAGINALSQSGPYWQWYTLETVIPGMDPADFTYGVNDTGLDSIPAPFMTPAYRSDRKVELQMTIDTYHVCITRKQVEAELRRRSIQFVRKSPFADDAAYTVPGRNKIVLSAWTFRGCVRQFQLSQITGGSRARSAHPPIGT